MGSIDAARIAGFLCRLCSEMHRTVIHIYGDQGQKHDLARKINAYLPVTIKPNDLLPKTICQSCMDRVEQHHELMLKLKQHEHVFTNSNSTRIARTTTTTTTSTASATTGTESTRQNSTTNSDDNNKNGSERPIC
ncbi:uncharacterized protein LOC116352018 [Contarinia nasturtii]|uniref:uncharacterized protein LOC116352018 n=1 Tax=Contarinia nasturtii TaxID=265458 RepID=UPI0012D4A2F8|nr:uncharacterized protein LOC116352018 [Contarinia nasturtii]